MKRKRWCVVLSVAFILLLFCGVRAVRGPLASKAAQQVEAGAACASTDENENVQATSELHLRQLETARDAQRVKQQEAAYELQRRQQEAVGSVAGDEAYTGL